MNHVTNATATFGGGCFWCLEAAFRELAGVVDVVSGYAGGFTVNPTYEQVCDGRTGHAEVVQISFDPTVITYADLLRVFFAIHDPTTHNRQGHDVGTQYRSIILTDSSEHAEQAARIKREIEEQAIWPAPIVTEIQNLEMFYPAENYHQHYFARNPDAGYCRVVVAPKLAKFRKEFYRRLIA